MVIMVVSTPIAMVMVKMTMAMMEVLNSILTIKENLYNQGQPPSDEVFFTVLQHAVSELIKQPELIVPLGIPVKDCEKAWGYSGTRLMACLRGLEYDLTHNPSYKDAKVPGAKITPKLVAAADKQTLPKGQFQQTEGKGCLNLRELGKCDVQGCKGKHEGTGFDHKPCTDPMYLELGLCPAFNHNSPWTQRQWKQHSSNHPRPSPKPSPRQM